MKTLSKYSFDVIYRQGLHIKNIRESKDAHYLWKFLSKPITLEGNYLILK